jgi:hypothetical protein
MIKPMVESFDKKRHRGWIIFVVAVDQNKAFVPLHCSVCKTATNLCAQLPRALFNDEPPNPSKA